MSLAHQLFLVLDESTVEFVLGLLAGTLSLGVGYVAYLGYRRNESLPMLFVAAGFLLTFWAPVVLVGSLELLDLGVRFAPEVAGPLRSAVSYAGRLSEIVGLLLILYGLAMPIRT